MPRSTLEPLAGRFRGKLIRPDDADYDEARTVFNAMIDKHPSLIAQCETVDDVVRAVQFGRDHDLEIAVRGGGHSVAGKGGERLSTTWPTPRSSLDLPTFLIMQAILIAADTGWNFGVPFAPHQPDAHAPPVS